MPSKPHGRHIRGLTLHRPWPWCFTHCGDQGKRVENRKWSPPDWMIGGYIALHSGKKFDLDAAYRMLGGEFGEAAKSVPMEDRDHPDSVITAVAILTDCYEYDEESADCWAFGPFCWELPEILVLDHPVKCRGAQGLWTLTDRVFDEIAAQVPAPDGTRDRKTCPHIGKRRHCTGCGVDICRDCGDHLYANGAGLITTPEGRAFWDKPRTDQQQ